MLFAVNVNDTVDIVNERFDHVSIRAQGSRTSYTVTFDSAGKPQLISCSHSPTCHCGDPVCPNRSLF